jgi:hypothetical protein
MRNFLKSVFLFTSFTLLVYCCCLIVSGLALPRSITKNFKYLEGGNGHLKTRLVEADSTKNIDLLFLGSSRAYRGYDTRKFTRFGYKTFNLGSSAQTPIQTELLLDEYIDQFNPKLVIFDVYPTALSSDGIESTLDLISNQPFNWETLDLAVKSGNIKVYNTLIYDFFDELTGEDEVEPTIKPNGDRYISGGFIEASIKSQKDIDKSGLVSYSVSDQQSAAVERILKRLDREGIEYLLIQSPLRADMYNKVTNNESIDSLFSSYGSYYNFNKILSLPDSMFLDHSHLNQYGVNVFNDAVIKLLAKKN